MHNFEESFVESDESFATVFVESGHFFTTEQVFMCFDKLKQWAYNTGLNNGYMIITQRSKTNVAGDKNKLFLRCDRGGVYKGKATVRHVGGTKKINCSFQLIAKYHKVEDGWKLKVVCGTHNHPPALYMEDHEFAKRLNPAQKVLVKDLTNQNVDPQNIISIIRKQNPRCVSTAKNVYNEQQRQRVSLHGNKSPMQVIFTLLDNAGYLQEHEVNESTHKLERLFIVHELSFPIWRAFPHVLFVDATYKTNRYGLPFVGFRVFPPGSSFTTIPTYIAILTFMYLFRGHVSMRGSRMAMSGR
ncbi:uncharacterized protein LOC143529374 [Bidens hawaiensis]|uniref:uncharacterized protein LOC143529374 n=1 Tax=Bidens hawaiensis TaxID=980011 RepID=UPI00404B85CF